MIARPTLPCSDRIRLRPLSSADLLAQVHGQDSEIVRWLSGKVNTEEEHRKALEQAEHEWTRRAHKFDLGIKKSSRPVSWPAWSGCSRKCPT